jgi:lysophospholipase L1-like esterase
MSSRRLCAPWILVALSLAAALWLGEMGLRLLLPLPFASVGSSSPEMARRYGWGYEPFQRLVLRDPDSGQVFVDATNNHGWRDADRSFDNPTGAFRILVLGDSNAFGVIVPAQFQYSRIVEKALRDEGYNVEVINISLAGWGTDQELAALLDEGLRYRPNVVVLHFCGNDIADNLQAVPQLAATRPFRYRLDDQGRLVRESKPVAASAGDPPWKVGAKAFIARSELLKRIYVVYRGMVDHDRRNTEGQLEFNFDKYLKLRMLFGVQDDDPLGRYLLAHMDRKLDREPLRAAIVASPHADHADAIMRLAERRWFLAHGVASNAPHDEVGSEGWRLTFALIGAVRDAAASVGAPLLLLSDAEEGLYRWEQSWFRVPPGEDAHQAYLAPTRFLRDWAAAHGVQFVEPVAAFERARNDPHPNQSGNRAIADSLLRHLNRNFTELLAAHRPH